jgi:hypothetical protein
VPGLAAPANPGTALTTAAMYPSYAAVSALTPAKNPLGSFFVVATSASPGSAAIASIAAWIAATCGSAALRAARGTRVTTSRGSRIRRPNIDLRTSNTMARPV